MAIKSQNHLITLHPIKLHIFLSKLYLTNAIILAILFAAISGASHLHGQTLNIADKALCASNIFCGIHEILLLFNKIKFKKMTDNLMIQAGLDFHYMFFDMKKPFLEVKK